MKWRISSTVKSAFTLVELLVVIFVISVLSALLVPAVSSAKESARKAKCSSNVRQIVMAMAIYAHDNDDYLPYAYFNQAPDFVWFDWSCLLTNAIPSLKADVFA